MVIINGAKMDFFPGSLGQKWWHSENWHKGTLQVPLDAV
jgi:hypothetical protein